MSSVRLVEGRIVTVDPVRFSCTVQLLTDSSERENVPFMPPYVANNAAGWMGALPEPGDFCLLAKLTGLASYNVLAYLSRARGETPETEDHTPLHIRGEPRNNFSAGRRPITPGDQGMWGGAGNGVIVRRSGITEVYADELTFTRWFPSDQSIRSVCSSFMIDGFFGKSELFTDRDDSTHTKSGFRSKLKASPEHGYIFSADIGHVSGDENLRLPGKPKRDDSYSGSVVLRLLIFDQETSNQYAGMGEEPPSRVARLAIRMDQEGNVLWVSAGMRTEIMSAYMRHVIGRETIQVDGSSTTRVKGSHSTLSEDVITLRGDRGVVVSTGGTFHVDCARFLLTETSSERSVEGDYAVSAGMSMKFSAGTSMKVSAGNAFSKSTVGNDSEVIGGRKISTILNGNPRNVGKDVTASGTKILSGKHKIHVVNGSYEVVLGPDTPGSQPIARIKIHADPRTPMQLGRITIGFPLSKAGLTLSPNGSFKLESGLSSVSGDASGRIQLGRKGVPICGMAITTATHPICYVTGAPIMGSPDVLISAGIPGASPTVPAIGAGLGPITPTIDLPESDAV